MAFLINGSTVVDDSRRFYSNTAYCTFMANTATTGGTGSDNVFIGRGTGCLNQTGGCNIFIGRLAGVCNTIGSYNNFIGQCAGYFNCSTACFNNFIGSGAGLRNTTGSRNTSLGNGAGQNNCTGNFNTAVGFSAGWQNTSFCNVFIGASAGNSNTTGCCNIYIGSSAGCSNISGSNNIYIGHATPGSTTASNRTCIGNTGTVTTYTFGDFISEGNVTAYSDESLKENIERIQNALEKVKSLEGVTYNRNDYPDKPRHMGLIAQCVEKVIPEVIGEADGKLTVAYGNLIALVVEAIKEIDERLEILEGK